MPGVGDLHDRCVERRPVDDRRRDGGRHAAGVALRRDLDLRGIGRFGMPGFGLRQINASVNLPPSGTATFTVTGTIAASATGTLTNTATVAPPAGATDPTPANNTATDTDTLAPHRRSVDHQDRRRRRRRRRASATYTIVATNAGPSARDRRDGDRHVARGADGRDLDLLGRRRRRPARPPAAATSTPRSTCRSAARRPSR